MKFIFPQNYNFKNKLFGIMDYTTIFINIIWSFIIFILVYFLFKDWSFRIFLFIFLSFPLVLFSIFGYQGENIVYIFSYLFRFAFSQKIFFFRKSD